MSNRAIAAMLSLVVTLAGCASTEVTDRQSYRGGRIARPDRILVHDFAASPSDLPAWSDVRGRHPEPSQPRTREEIAAGRELGGLVASQLVEEIREMGIPAARTAAASAPRRGDVVLVGYFESIDEGSRLKRVVIGFGSGTAELKTQVEGYLKTDEGMRKLGAGAVDSGGAGKMPGVVVPIIVTAVTANPVGLIVGGVVKAEGELTGRTTIEGSARRTADAIAEELRAVFRKNGWIR
jgi:hypothetical protein